MDSTELTDFLDEKLSGQQQIGIFCSGGFDSSLLLYSICRIFYFKKLNKDLHIFTVPRYDDSVEHSTRVINWVKKLYPTIQYKIGHPGNPDLHHSEQVVSGIKEILKNHQNMLLFLGDTANPKHLQGENEPKRIVSQNPNVLQPFINCDKTSTVKISIQYGILNILSQLTHTCTESKTVRCRLCWQCKERLWAFNTLGIQDIGIM